MTSRWMSRSSTRVSTDAFPVATPPEGVGVTPYVLGKMEASIAEAAPRAADAVEEILSNGPEAAMNRFNVKQ